MKLEDPSRKVTRRAILNGLGCAGGVSLAGIAGQILPTTRPNSAGGDPLDDRRSGGDTTDAIQSTEPTAREIEDSLIAGVRFLQGIVQDVYSAPKTLGEPIDTGRSVLAHNAGPPVYGIIEHPGGAVEPGKWQANGPGNVPYRPIKLRRPLQYLFLNREGHVSYDATRETGPNPAMSGRSFRENVTIHFRDPDAGLDVAEYEVTRMSWWGGDIARPEFAYFIRQVSALDESWHDGKTWGGVGWSTYELLDLGDGEQKAVWYAKRHPDPKQAGPIPSLSEYPIKLHNTVRYFFDEMGSYYDDPGLKRISSRIREFVEFWQDQYGVMERDFLDLMYGFTYEDGWIRDRRTFYEPEFWSIAEESFGRTHPSDVYTLALSPYKSHLVHEYTATPYLSLVWKTSPYQKSLEALDALHRGGHPAVVRESLGQWIDWDGLGVPLAHSYPLPSFLVEELAGRTLPSRNDGQGKVYRGDVLGGYFLALMYLLYYARSAGTSAVEEWAIERAAEVVNVVRWIQIPWDGGQRLPDGTHVKLPEEAGGFMGAFYKFDDAGPLMASWDPREFRWLEEGADSSGLWTNPNYPWPGAGSQAFETTLMCLKGLKMYKELVLDT